MAWFGRAAELPGQALAVGLAIALAKRWYATLDQKKQERVDEIAAATKVAVEKVIAELEKQGILSRNKEIEALLKEIKERLG